MDAAHSKVVVFGGNGSSGDNQSAELGDTWTWDGTAWSQLNPTTSPPAREQGAMVYDPDTHTLVLFGGCCYSVGGVGTYDYQDTWTWDGTTWTQQHPTTSPPALRSASMTYDPVHHQVVLFGGYSTTSDATCDSFSGACNGTWTWDGTNWTLQTPSTSPCVRYGALMAYDAATQNTVLFGGYNYSSPRCAAHNYLNDTWTWDGSNWTKLTPAQAPTYAGDGGMAYDIAHQVIVLDGNTDSPSVNDTWTWNGTTWTHLTPTTSPPASANQGVVEDSVHNLVLQVGGKLWSNSTITGALWAWDGTNWAPNPAASLSASLSGPASLTADTVNHVYTPSTFTVTATISNGGPQTATAPEAILSLPTGFSLASTDSAVHHLADLAANGSVQTSWSIVSPQADTVAAGGPSTFTVRADAVNVASFVSAFYSITVPPLEGPGTPTGVAVAALNGQAIVKWTPPTTGLPLTSYQVQAYAPDGVTTIGSPVTVDGAATSTTITGLNNDCNTGRYRFTVSASNSLGPNPGTASPLTSTVITAGHASDVPQAVVILVQGLSSSLPTDAAHEGYDPRSYSGCALRDALDGKISAYDIPGFLKQTASSFDPNPADPAYQIDGVASPDLTDRLALNGAVILPYSYRGGGLIGNPGDAPALYVNPYGAAEPGRTMREAAANFLDAEVGSAHRVWPNSPIVIIGHSNGGLVAETLFEKHASTVTNDNVKAIFAVDSPINGINDPGLLADALWTWKHPGDPVLSNDLVAEYHDLWNNRQTRDTQLIQQDQQMGNVFVPIGTSNDELYAAADSTTLTPDHSFSHGTGAQWMGIDSQVFCTAFTLGQPCQTGGPSMVAGGNPVTGHILPAPPYIPSHSWILTRQSWVDLLGNSVLSTGSQAATRSSSATSTSSTVPTLAPTSGLTAPAASPGDTITLNGTNLGMNAGQVTFADVSGNRIPGVVTAWSPAHVQVVVPATAATGTVYAITAAGDESYSGGLTILDISNGVAALHVMQTTTATDGSPVSVTVLAVATSGLPAAGVPVTPSSGLATGTPVTTDALGRAVIPITDRGSTNLVFYSGNVYTTEGLTWTPAAPTSVTVSVPAGSYVAGATIPVQAAVTIGGQPAPAGTQVSFALSGADTASLTADTAVTDASGNAATSVVNTLASAVQVRASTSDNSSSGTTTATWLPTVTGVSPNTGSFAGGTTVTITGTGFVAPSKVYFGANAASSVTVVNSTTMTATAPAASTGGNVDVVVEAPGGQSQTNSGDVFTYSGAPSAVPTVTSVSPRSGPSAGGTTVTVNGTGFVSGVTVQFGSLAGTSVVVISSTQLTVTSPTASAGTVDVTVTGSGGTSAISAPDQYTYT